MELKMTGQFKKDLKRYKYETTKLEDLKTYSSICKKQEQSLKDTSLIAFPVSIKIVWNAISKTISCLYGLIGMRTLSNYCGWVAILNFSGNIETQVMETHGCYRGSLFMNLRY